MEFKLSGNKPSWQTFDDFYSTTASGRSLPLQDSDRFVSYHLEDLWPEWQEQGRCLGVGNDYFFGDEDEQPTMNIKQIRQAAKLCDVCPVFRECLRHSLEQKEEYGVWASTSGRVRRKIFRMIEAGEVTVDEVIEDYANGRRAKYTGPNGGSSGSRVRRRDAEPGGAGLQDAVGV